MAGPRHLCDSCGSNQSAPEIRETLVNDFDPDAWENGLIADMRAHNGEITSGPMAGRPTLLLTATGAKSGEPRRVILNFTRDGDDLVIAGTKGGAPRDPIWVGNLRANPEVTVEAGGRSFGARATIVSDPAERQRLWDAHAAAMPWFAEYPEKTGGRIIPVIRLTEIAGSQEPEPGAGARSRS